MKLFYAATSPYARKVRVVAIETGLSDRIEEIADAAKVYEPTAALLEHNPLGKVPTLVPEGRPALFDSRVICEYLDANTVAARLFPAVGQARWDALGLQALADGLMDAAMLLRQESLLRPHEQQSEEWRAAQLRKVIAALHRLEAGCHAFPEQVTIGTVAVGCALGYLDFRFAEMGWRKRHALLAAWFDGFAQRPSMLATRPPF